MRIPMVAALALLLAGCNGAPSQPPTDTTEAKRTAESARLTAYLDAEYEKELAMSPESLTGLGRKENVRPARRPERGGRRSQARMAAKERGGHESDVRPRAARRRRRKPRTTSGRRSSNAPNAITRSAGTSTCSGSAATHTGLPQFLINFHRVDDKRDMEAYIARLSQFDAALDQLLVRAQAAAAEGIRPPAFSFARTLDEIKRVSTGAPFTPGADSALFADAKAKIAALVKNGKVTDAEAATLTAAATNALTPK